MLRYKLFKVKTGKLETLKAWSEELRSRTSEVLATLEYENVVAETFYAFSISGEWYAMGMQSLSGGHRKADMDIELNRRHIAVLNGCLEPIAGSVLYEFGDAGTASHRPFHMPETRIAHRRPALRIGRKSQTMIGKNT